MLKRRILLAEDDADDQQFFKSFLEDYKGIIIMPVADDGEALFELLSRIDDPTGLPDLIILDQNMPKINGLRALQVLKTDKRYAHIPVCIYSTYTDEELIKRGLENGACQVVPKPTSKEGYHQMIEDLFRNGVLVE